MGRIQAILQALKELAKSVSDFSWASVNKVLLLEIIGGMAIVGTGGVLLYNAFNANVQTTSTGYEYTHPPFEVDVLDPDTAIANYGDWTEIDMTAVAEDLGFPKGHIFSVTSNGHILPTSTDDVYLYGRFHDVLYKTVGITTVLKFDKSTKEFSVAVPASELMSDPSGNRTPTLISDKYLALVGSVESPRPGKWAWTDDAALRGTVDVYDLTTGQLAKSAQYNYDNQGAPLAAGPCVINTGSGTLFIGTWRYSDEPAADGKYTQDPWVFSYDLAANRLAPEPDMQLPISAWYGGPVQFANQATVGTKTYFLASKKMYRLDHATKKTEFLGHMELPAVYGSWSMQSALLANRYLVMIGEEPSNGIAAQAAMGLFDIQTNQFYYRQLETAPFKEFVDSKAWLAALDSGTKPNLDNEEWFSSPQKGFLYTILDDGTVLMASEMKWNMPWAVSLVNIKDFVPLKNPVLDSTDLLDSMLTYDDWLDRSNTPTRLGTGRYFRALGTDALMMSGKLWYLYSSHAPTTIQQSIAATLEKDWQLPSSDFDDRGIWTKAKGEITIYPKYADAALYDADDDINWEEGVADYAYALPDNRILFVKPVQKRVGNRYPFDYEFANGTLGQIYDPTTGESEIVSSTKLTSLVYDHRSLQHDLIYDFANGIVDKEGRVHFFGDNDTVLIVDARANDIVIKDLTNSGPIKSFFLPNKPSFDNGTQWVVVGDKVLFYNLYSLIETEENAQWLPPIPTSFSGDGARRVIWPPYLVLYDTNSSTYFDLTHKLVQAEFGDQDLIGNTELSKLKKERLPIVEEYSRGGIKFSDEFFEHSSTRALYNLFINWFGQYVSVLRGDALAIDDESVVIVAGSKIMVFNIKDITTSVWGRLNLPNPRYLFLDDDGNLIAITQDGAERFDIGSNTSEVLTTDPETTYPFGSHVFYLYGNRLMSFSGIDNRPTIYDLNTQKTYWTAQPFVLPRHDNVTQLADQSVVIYDSAVFDPSPEIPTLEDLLAIPWADVPNIARNELQRFIP
ncbi:MAG: hypothetical protein PHR51_00420 [Patescibacteria group bacterium]|nr:hypothetical protein [Patescibacteria group bacterium]